MFCQGTGGLAGAAAGTACPADHELPLVTEAFGVMAPGTGEGAALEKDRCPDSGAVKNSQLLDIKNNAPDPCHNINVNVSPVKRFVNENSKNSRFLILFLNFGFFY
jgi:hypothetical protein